MLSMILPAHEKHYKPHADNIILLNENDELCGSVAWWSDNPLEDACREADTTVKMLADYKVKAIRKVLKDGVEVYVAGNS